MLLFTATLPSAAGVAVGESQNPSTCAFAFAYGCAFEYAVDFAFAFVFASVFYCPLPLPFPLHLDDAAEPAGDRELGRTFSSPDRGVVGDLDFVFAAARSAGDCDHVEGFDRGRRPVGLMPSASDHFSFSGYGFSVPSELLLALGDLLLFYFVLLLTVFDFAFCFAAFPFTPV